MVLLKLHTKCVKNQYKSHICSKATVFVLVLNCALIVLPFIFAYHSKGFWLKHDTFFEQPNVKFKGEYLFVAQTNNISHPILCNNFPSYQQHSKLDVCNKIKVREIDNNLDGKYDNFDVFIYIDLENNVKIQSFDLILIIDYKLHAQCPFVMQSAIIHQMYIPHDVSDIEVVADLGITQTFPLFCHAKKKDTHYNYSVIEKEDSEDSYNLRHLIKQYARRNVTTHLKNIYTTYETNDSENLMISLHIRYPIQRFYYKPGFWQIMKHAWIQYYALLVLLAFILSKVKNYVFENRLILYYKYTPFQNDN